MLVVGSGFCAKARAGKRTAKKSVGRRLCIAMIEVPERNVGALGL
jgi:hypothetical protein